MSLAKKCDRCGKFHDHYEHNVSGRNYNSVTLTNINATNNHVSDSKMFNLCPECLDEFAIFITRKKENNDESISE